MKHYHDPQANEMRRLLEQEILHWPNVSSKKLFGCPGYQAGGKLFAFLVTDGVVLTQLEEAEREALFRQYPATFFQTHKGDLWETEIPFDLAVDYVPQLLRDPDKHLQHLAANAPRYIDGFQPIIGESKAIRLVVGRAQILDLRPFLGDHDDVAVQGFVIGGSDLFRGEGAGGLEISVRLLQDRGDDPGGGSLPAARQERLPAVEEELTGFRKTA